MQRSKSTRSANWPSAMGRSCNEAPASGSVEPDPTTLHQVATLLGGKPGHGPIGHRRSPPACLHDPGYADPNRVLARHDRRADDLMMTPSSKELCVVLVFSPLQVLDSKG